MIWFQNLTSELLCRATIICPKYSLFSENVWSPDSPSRLVFRNLLETVNKKTTASQTDWQQLFHQGICNVCLSTRGQHKPVLVSLSEQDCRPTVLSYALINSHVFQPWCCDWIENTNYNFIGHGNKHDVDQENVQGVSYQISSWVLSWLKELDVTCMLEWLSRDIKMKWI